MKHLGKIYTHRFRMPSTGSAQQSRENAWKVIYEKVFQRFVTRESVVLDLGSRPGFFINQVQCVRAMAVDLDENNRKFLREDIEFFGCSSQNLHFASDNSIDLIFSSNLLEHLGSSEIILETLREAHRVLKDENSFLIVLMPNIRYVKWDFFDFLDHNFPMNEISLKEALEVSKFEVVESHKRFFPYSAQRLRFSTPQFIVRLYLMFPPRCRPFAKQMLFIARPIEEILL